MTTTNEKLLSVIVPSHNEEENILQTADKIAAILDAEEIFFELLFVDDGSQDHTWEKLQLCCLKDERVRGIRLSRNFGKEAAIYAGLHDAEGACCAVIDCDLQHPPEKLVEMYRLWEQGYEVIEGIKRNRGEESPVYRAGAAVFYSLISKATGIDLAHSSDFKLLDRKAVVVLLNMRERNTFFRALSSWVGFKTTSVEYDVLPRKAGKTNWSLWSLFKYAVSSVTSFTTAPMQLVTILGVLMLLVSLILGVNALYQKFAGIALGGFTTVIIIQLFTGSIVMISLGIIGYYISKIYEEVKGRPKYIVSDTCRKHE